MNHPTLDGVRRKSLTGLGALCGALILVSACSSQHLPQSYEPFFPLAPEGFLQPDLVSELSLLDKKKVAGLTPAESLRLLELVQSESRHLQPTASRLQEIKTQASELEKVSAPVRRQVDSLRDDLSQALRDSREDKDEEGNFSDAAVRARYLEISRLWNQNENEAAFEKAELADKDEDLKDSLSDAQRLRFDNLRFRIALDRNDWTTIEHGYEQLKDNDDCAPATAEAALLLGLHLFLENQSERAYETLHNQCDEDASVYAATRRKYWLARFSEKRDPYFARDQYRELSASYLPHYYGLLAAQRLGLRMALPPRNPQKAYLSQPLTVSGRVDDWLTLGESWLSNNLRREGQLALRRAALRLKKDESPEALLALLYTAHLHEAAGSSLDAMRIYSVVVENLIKHPEWLSQVGYEFLPEMFPRPHSNLIEPFARYWGVDPDFIYAIIRQESAFNPSAVSPANARGWMQLMPFLAEQIASEWGFAHYYQSEFLFLAPENVKLASYHISKLNKILPHPALVAAAYNAGVKRVANWWRNRYMVPTDVFVELIPIGETRNYVKLVTRNYYYYKMLQLPAGGTIDPAAIPLGLPQVVEGTTAGL